MYDEIRIAIEVVSAIMCFSLLRFVIKPYEITGESRYIGLPLGFGFLGATYVISAISFYVPNVFGRNTLFLQLIARTFAFLFIAITYYFSKEPTKNSRLVWKITLAIVSTLLIISILIVSLPFINLDSYKLTRDYLRVFNLIVILYICGHTFRSHIKKPDSTIWIPLGYTFLAVSQYSLFLFQLDRDFYAFFAGLILRLVFLSVLLFISCKAFFGIKKEAKG